jgi:molybdopterin-guanine dinucleotide biosynthesis protein A
VPAWLRYLQTVDAAYITSCDVPLLVPAFRARMVELAEGYDIAITENEGFAHPLSANLQPGRAAACHGAASRRPAACVEPVPTSRTRRVPAST